MLARLAHLRRRLNRPKWLAAALVPAWCGAAVVAGWRFLVGPGALIVLAVALVVAAVGSIVGARRTLATMSQVAALADREAKLGGLLLTRLERPVGAWELAVNQGLAQLPPQHAPLGRPALLLALVPVFLALSFAVPLPQRTGPMPNPAAAVQLETLAERLEVLSAEEPVANAQAELTRLREELAQGRFDAVDWEASENLDAHLAQQASDARTALATAQQAAAALAQAQPGADTTREEEALQRALMALDDNHPSAPSTTGQGTGGQGGAREQASALREALARRQERLEKAFPDTQSSGRPSASSGSKPAGVGQQRGTGGRDSTELRPDGQAHASRQVNAGTGGDDEPADSHLVFGGAAQMDPKRLAFEPLNPGAPGDEATELLGLKAVDPRVSARSLTTVSSGANAVGGPAAGWSDGPLLPRNRAVVEKYFGGARQSK